MNMKNSTAFTLLELSVVLLISALLLIISFEGSKFILIKNQFQATEKKLDTIEKAIEIYVRANGHLPCPTYMNNTDGIELANCYNHRGTNETTGIHHINKVINGGIPFKTLNLSYDYAYDSWGNKFTYSVYQPATRNIRSLEKDGSTRYLSVYENRIQNDNLISNNVLYTIVAHGKNKNCGYNARTGKIADCQSGVDYPNAGKSDKQNVIYFPNNEVADDIVRYKTATQLITDYGIEDMNCCVTTDIINDLLSSLKVTGVSFSGFNSSCKYLMYNEEKESSGSGDYKLKCFKYGRLGLIKDVKI